MENLTNSPALIKKVNLKIPLYSRHISRKGMTLRPYFKINQNKSSKIAKALTLCFRTISMPYIGVICVSRRSLEDSPRIY